jgi:hypothetical protein
VRHGPAFGRRLTGAFEISPIPQPAPVLAPSPRVFRQDKELASILCVPPRHKRVERWSCPEAKSR